LTDFGIARAENSKQALDASGTPGYMAPEVLCKQMHAYEVDFYAIGIIAHELMLGRVLFLKVRGHILATIVSKSEMLCLPSSILSRR
jgi:serine/threonine protein kinase